MRTWISDSRSLEPVLGRKFHVESEFQVQNDGFQASDGKTLEKPIMGSSYDPSCFLDACYHYIVERKQAVLALPSTTYGQKVIPESCGWSSCVLSEPSVTTYAQMGIVVFFFRRLENFESNFFRSTPWN